MKCEYCQQEIKCRAYRQVVMPKFEIMTDIPKGDEVTPSMFQPITNYVCKECMEDMGIHVTN